MPLVKSDTGLCRRRHWPEPHYESFPYSSFSSSYPPPKLASPKTTTNATKTGISPSSPPQTEIGITAETPPTGYACIVRVNNREYQTDKTYASETLARENAAMRAYLICRNFSVNDGMYPSGHDHGGVVQGVPVAIGTGRKGGCSNNGGGCGGVDGTDHSGVGVGVGGGRREMVEGNKNSIGSTDTGRGSDRDDASTASSSDFSMSLGSRSQSGGSISPDGSCGSPRSNCVSGNGHRNGYAYRF